MSAMSFMEWETKTTVFPLLASFLKCSFALAMNAASPTLRISSTSIMSDSTFIMIENASLPDIPEEYVLTGLSMYLDIPEYSIILSILESISLRLNPYSSPLRYMFSLPDIS